MDNIKLEHVSRPQQGREVGRHLHSSQDSRSSRRSVTENKLPSEVISSFLIKNDIRSGHSSFHMVDNKKHVLAVPPLEPMTGMPGCYLDLKEGYIRKREEGGKTHQNRYNEPDKSFISNWLMENKVLFDQLQEDGKYFPNEFITWRRTLTQLMESIPFPAEFSVIKFGGSYFLVYNKTPEQGYWANSEDANLSTYSGLRFRKYMRAPLLKEDQWIDPQLNDVMYENMNVLQVAFRSHDFLFPTVVDCMGQHDLQENDMRKYIDFHTYFRKPNEGQFEFKMSKMLHWKAQCFWSGVETIYCGIKNEDFVVTCVERFDISTFETRRYERTLEQMKDHMDIFFNFVKEQVKDDDPHTSHLFYWDPMVKKWHFYPRMGRHFLTDEFISHFTN